MYRLFLIRNDVLKKWYIVWNGLKFGKFSFLEIYRDKIKKVIKMKKYSSSQSETTTALNMKIWKTNFHQVEVEPWWVF